MRKIHSAGLFAFFFILAPSVGATEDRNGNWWNAQPHALQVSWVIGLLDGIAVADNFIIFDLELDAMSSDMPNCNTKGCYEKLSEYSRNLDTSIKRFQRKFAASTAGTIADGLSQLYSDFRNRQINIVDAIGVVMDSVAGSTEAQIQKRLEKLWELYAK
jgi:hypothetical protein